MRIKYIVPLPLEERDLADRAAQVELAALDAETHVECVAVRNAPLDADSYYSDLIFDMYVVEAGLNAAEEGFDAVVIDTVSDSGLYPLRSRLDIPVLGPGLVAYCVATLLGQRFSIITLSDRWRHFYEKNLTSYQLWPHCASVRSLGRDVSSEATVTAGAIDAQLLTEAERAIRDDGADVIVLGSTSMHRAGTGVASALKIPVINPGPVALKMAETLVRLGLGHSKRAFAAPRQPNDGVFRALVSQGLGK